MAIQSILSALPQLQGEDIFELFQRKKLERAGLDKMLAEAALEKSQIPVQGLEASLKQKELEYAPTKMGLESLLSQAKIGRERALAEKAAQEAGVIPSKIDLNRAQRQYYNAKALAAMNEGTFTPQKKIQLETNAKNYANLQNKASQISSQAYQQLKMLEDAADAYSKISSNLRRGTFSTLTKPVRDALQQRVEAVTSALTLGELSKTKLVPVSDKDIELVQQGLPALKKNPEAFMRALRRVESGLRISGKFSEFLINYAHKNDDLNPAVAQEAWAQFLKREDVIDDEGRILPQKLDNWDKYVSPEFLDKLRTGSLKETPDYTIEQSAQIENLSKIFGRSKNQLMKDIAQTAKEENISEYDVLNRLIDMQGGQ